MPNGEFWFVFKLTRRAFKPLDRLRTFVLPSVVLPPSIFTESATSSGAGGAGGVLGSGAGSLFVFLGFEGHILIIHLKVP